MANSPKCLVTRLHLGERLPKVERAQRYRKDIVGSPAESALLDIDLSALDGEMAGAVCCAPTTLSLKSRQATAKGAPLAQVGPTTAWPSPEDPRRP